MLVAAVLAQCLLAVGVFATYEQSCTHSTEDFDFFVFIELSPGCDCYIGIANCSWPHPTWVMHGMWPSAPSDTQPCYCNSSAHFNIEEVQDLLPRLNFTWPTLERPYEWGSCYGNLTQYMWCHEWLKHGTCASGIQDMRTEHGYFSTVLWLYETRLNFDKFVLAKHNIVPSTTQTYNLDDFVSAFKTELKVTPIPTCYWVKNYQILESIRICLTRAGYHPMECPDSVFADSNGCSYKYPLHYLPS